MSIHTYLKFCFARCTFYLCVFCLFLCGTGTFITEWKDGEKTCEAFLAGEKAYRSVADKLVQIAHCYGFDGWLINIENGLSVSECYITYYKTLKRACGSGHVKVPTKDLDIGRLDLVATFS